MQMKRGEIYFAVLDPTIGSEIKKQRPVLIISNDANNNAAATLTVIPLTSKTEKVYPFEVLLNRKDSGLMKPSKAQCQQIRTISKLRIRGKRVGIVNKNIIMKIEKALKLHLDFID